MKKMVYVVIMGALGTISRYGFALVFPSLLETLLVNLIGCFLLAMVFDYWSVKSERSEEFIGALSTGFLGSFTTFSTFSMENVSLLTEGAYATAIIYISLSLICGLLAALAGKTTAESLKKEAKI